MLIEVINVSKDDLNASSGVVNTITDHTLAISDTQNRNYRPTKVKIVNGSGATINFNLLSDFEYTSYIDDQTISGLFPLADGSTEEFTNPLREITTIICSGTVAHTSGVSFVIVKE